jgi:hypothetical protein
MAASLSAGENLDHPSAVRPTKRRLEGTGVGALAAGAVLLRTAVRALHFERGISYRCYVLALGCTDLAGYSRACARQASQRRARQDAASDRCASARADASAGAEQSLDRGDDLPGVGRPDALGQRLREIGQEVA